MTTTDAKEPDASWARVTLGDLLTVLRGVTYKKEDAQSDPNEGLVPILRASNINGHLVFDDLVYVPQRYVSGEQFLRPGDIVVAASSGSSSVVGKAAPLRTAWHGSFGAFCFGLRPSRHVNEMLLAYYLQTTEYRNRVSELASGIGINNLRRNHIEDTPFKLPPFPEQHRIVDEIEKQFSRLDEGVENLKRVKANLKRYRASVLQAACEGRLVPSESELARNDGREYEPASELLKRILVERRHKWEENELAKMRAKGKEPADDKWKARYQQPAAPDTSGLPELPEGWCWINVALAASSTPNAITDGPFGSNLKTEHYTESGARVIRLQNIGDGVFVDAKAHITEAHYARLVKHKVETGDLVIAAFGSRPPRACIIPPFVGSAIVKADCIRLHPDLGLADPRFLNYALNAESTRARTVSSVHGVGRPRLNLGEIKAIALPLPPLTEQHRIVAEVDRRLSIIDQMETAVEANLKRAQRLRQAILKRAFEGKLVPQDPNDEPAGVLLERIRAERNTSRETGKRTRVGAW